ncbi:hypothetical protein C1O63_1553 [Dehalococcoides mccartyi]|nr:hypothetical protein C1O63_1553 [Dehalococcoides mccartyi]
MIPILTMPLIRFFKDSGINHQTSEPNKGGKTVVTRSPIMIGSQANPFCQAR